MHRGPWEGAHSGSLVPPSVRRLWRLWELGSGEHNLCFRLHRRGCVGRLASGFWDGGLGWASEVGAARYLPVVMGLSGRRVRVGELRAAAVARCCAGGCASLVRHPGPWTCRRSKQAGVKAPRVPGAPHLHPLPEHKESLAIRQPQRRRNRSGARPASSRGTRGAIPFARSRLRRVHSHRASPLNRSMGTACGGA